jgi:hypothetical protein
MIAIAALIPAVFYDPSPAQTAPKDGEISSADVRAVPAERLLWIDTRKNAGGPTIAGAKRLNSWSWDEQLPAFLDAWEPELAVVIFGAYGSDESHAIANRLAREIGISRVFVLSEPWEVFVK